MLFSFYCHGKKQPEQIPALINGPASEVIGNLEAVSLHFASHLANLFYVLLGISSQIWGSSGLTAKGNQGASQETKFPGNTIAHFKRTPRHMDGIEMQCMQEMVVIVLLREKKNMLSGVPR